MTRDLSVILDDFECLARTIPTEDCRKDLKPLLKFYGNLNEPIHRWYKFKESFSHALVPFLLRHYATPSSRLAFLDPFCGVGTSLLAVDAAAPDLHLRNVRLSGVEVNPYIHFVANTKLTWDEYDPGFMMRAAAVATNGVPVRRRRPSRPNLSTLQNPRFISPDNLDELLLLQEKVRTISRNRPERRPLLLGLAAGAERVLNLRKDGRALRYLPRDTNPSVGEAVFERWHQIAEDLQLGLQRSHNSCRILRGDGRRPDHLFARQRFNIIAFSPPYLNNIDYTEVYKVELWLLGFLTSRQAMTTLRQRTFRSHPSCIFPSYHDANAEEVTSLLGEPFRRLLTYARHREPWRHRLFTEYFADMLRTLRGCSRLLTNDGRVFLVVGNSLHGSSQHPIPVATDIWISRLAPAAGLRVECLLLGRDFSRRRLNTPLLRESVIIMRKE